MKKLIFILLFLPFLSIGQNTVEIDFVEYTMPSDTGDVQCILLTKLGFEQLLSNIKGGNGGGNNRDTDSELVTETGKTDAYGNACLGDADEKQYLIEKVTSESELYSLYNSSNDKRRCRDTYTVAQWFGLEKKQSKRKMVAFIWAEILKIRG